MERERKRKLIGMVHSEKEGEEKKRQKKILSRKDHFIFAHTAP